MAWMSTCSRSTLRVKVRHSYRVRDIASFRSQAATEVLPVENAFDFALERFGDVYSVGVEKADHYRLRVFGEEPYGNASSGPLGADPEAGHRDRRHLQVATSTPPALRPATTDCFSIRAARLVSRETVTVAPRGIVVAYAMARRTASSGEMSTFARPETPVRPNR